MGVVDLALFPPTNHPSFATAALRSFDQAFCFNFFFHGYQLFSFSCCVNGRVRKKRKTPPFYFWKASKAWRSLLTKKNTTRTFAFLFLYSYLHLFLLVCPFVLSVRLIFGMGAVLDFLFFSLKSRLQAQIPRTIQTLLLWMSVLSRFTCLLLVICVMIVGSRSHL